MSPHRRGTAPEGREAERLDGGWQAVPTAPPRDGLDAPGVPRDADPTAQLRAPHGMRKPPLNCVSAVQRGFLVWSLGESNP